MNVRAHLLLTISVVFGATVSLSAQYPATQKDFRETTWGMTKAQVRAKYLFDAEHEELNDFIADYHAVEPLLRRAFGEPAGQRAVWEDDSLQEERKSYLDQDRATPESILPSDRNAGLAVSLGHLKLYTEWGEGRTAPIHTKVLHAMTGVDGKITHQIEYRSEDLGAVGSK